MVPNNEEKKNFLIILLILNMVIFTGCWNYRELESMALVAGIAIDKGKDGSGYLLTIETLDVLGGGEKGSTTVKPALIESEGKTIFDAIRNAMERSDKKLYLGTCRAIIISDELAREGIAKIIDVFNRDAEPRITIDFYIAKDKAKEIIQAKGLSNTITSFTIDKIDENNLLFLSKGLEVKLYELNNILGGQGVSLALPVFDTTNNQDEKVVELDGTAIFKKDKLIGYLEREETKYLVMLKNKMEGGLILVNIDSDTPDVTLEVFKSEAKIKPVLTGEIPKINIEVSMQVALGELQTTEDLSTEEGIKKIEKKASEVIQTNIKKLISKVQKEYGSDIFGLGSAIYISNPSYWEKIKANWDALFKSLEISVSADVKIQNTGEIQKKVKVGD